MMTSSLAKAVEQVEHSDPQVQDLIAALIEEELRSERGWDDRFAGSQNVLAELARKAIKDNRAGETLPWPDEHE